MVTVPARMALAIAAAALPGGAPPRVLQQIRPSNQTIHWRRSDGRKLAPACDQWARGPTATNTEKVTCPKCRAAIPGSI